MRRWSNASKRQLDTCDKRLIDLFESVLHLSPYDIRVIEGHRSVERQEELYRQGFSKVLNSKHNFTPSRAIDVVPLDNKGRIDWNNRERFVALYGAVMAIAKQQGVDIRWGGDWDRDTDLHDQTFMDLAHWELM